MFQSIICVAAVILCIIIGSLLYIAEILKGRWKPLFFFIIVKLRVYISNKTITSYNYSALRGGLSWVCSAELHFPGYNEKKTWLISGDVVI